MPELRRQKRALLREQILAAARGLFIERGYRNINISDIALRSHITRRTIYAHFPTKEELLMTLHLKGLSERLAVMKKAMDPAPTGIAKIEAFGKVYFRHYKKNPDQLLLQVIMDAEKLDHKRISRDLMSDFNLANAEGHRLIEDALKLGKRDGTISKNINVKLYFIYLVFTLRAIAKQTLYPALIPVPSFGNRFYFGYLKLLLKSIGPQPDDPKERR